MRTNDYPNGSRPSSDSRRRHNNIYDDDNDNVQDYESGSTRTHSNDFQPGAIVRVKLTNFVTYTDAEFFPGPNLNMVIGPNGTGKSSLVCAICLGLGWGPQHLGRASQLGEFVKHNTNDAIVEIELQRRPDQPRNHVIRLRIIKDGNHREWWLDGKKTSHKAVQEVTRRYNIQVDNLCQFLPQDKVSAFAALSPVELLLQTQRAAAPELMLQQHEKLKELSKGQKALEAIHEQDKESLRNWESRQEGLRGEVERLQERQAIEEKVLVLQKTVPFVEYKITRAAHLFNKAKKEAAQAKLKELEARVEPTRQLIRHKEDYRDQVTTVVKCRETAVARFEHQAAELQKTIETLDQNIEDHNSEAKAEKENENKRRAELTKIRRKITELKARAQEEPVEFNAAEWNEKIRAKEKELRDINIEARELKAEHEIMMGQGRIVKKSLNDANIELASLNTQEGQQLSILEKLSRETAEAWKWVQENTDRFEKPVYGPPLISCSVKDNRYTAAIESLFRRGDYLAITTQTPGDHKILSEEFWGNRGVKGEFPIRRSDGSGLNERPMSAQELQKLGMDGWAIDFIDGPEAVLSMLCSTVNINKTGVTLRDISEDQYNAILGAERLNSVVAGSQSYRISRRREYGPQAVSTSTSSFGPATHWVDQPVDNSAKDEIQRKINSLQSDFDTLKARITPTRAKITELENKAKEVLPEIKELREEKAVQQRARTEFDGLPTKIESAESDLAAKETEGSEYQARIRNLQVKHDSTVLMKAKQVLEYRNVIEKIRSSHEDLLEAQIRLIEAKSDVESLKIRHRDIDQKLENEQRIAKEAEDISKVAKREASAALAVCQQLRADPENAAHLDAWGKIGDDITLDSLQDEIRAEQAKLEFVHANNPNALRDFEKRQSDIDKMKEKIGEAERRINKLSRKIKEIRDEWEPALDTLIGEISTAFAHNFEEIGCAGEVGVHKDEDFDLWAVEIKVKFRETEPLQILDQHRQSGGERSVSTIFYLMSLQALARAPFRVVDEINQGMDPRNERMVHERMVEIACKEHTSQYFLITPKLLTGLRYDERMKVLCIASGEHMPGNYKKLDISKIINIRKSIMASG
ncbi:P-loop containing nucleoside triphosphate hydrolase protein [Tricladium varicosporioides]|nr:P-loop containing nucleoside triphosphate hydrolase protein [Hymenoscyphus varicosporioides]